MDAFTEVGFGDRKRAEQRLTQVLGPAPAGLADSLAHALALCADPDAALLGLERFLEASPAPDDARARMAAEPRCADLACTIFDQSHFLTDIVCRRPEHMAWLWDEAPLDRARSRDEMVAAMLEWVRDADSTAAYGLAMRRFKQREILRIAVRDVYVHATLASVTKDLSNLADAALEAALRRVLPELEERFGKPVCADPTGAARDVSFAVIALGKLGGRELNFSSDIDLLFIYSEHGRSAGGRSRAVDTAEYFQKLGEQVIGLVSEQSAEGFLFRVDMRLRPYGRMSPLAISLDAALAYYSGYAQPWERQALIKARPAAGDLELAARFVDETRPLVFPRYFDDETLEAIRDIKRQTEAQTAARGYTEHEVKLGRGGIRDIEFTVQTLQMLNGGRMPQLQTPRTLEAIQALGRRAHLTAFEATTLASNYAFLRQVEHRLQIEGGVQCHVLPSAPEKLDRLARRLGYASGASFTSDFRDRGEATRAILERFLASEGSGQLWTYDLLSVHCEGDVGKARLAEYGFQDPEKARRELLLLSAGTEAQPHPLHVRQQFAAIVTGLLEALAASPDPDGTLVRLGRILANLRAPAAVYETIKGNPAYCQYLVTLISNSEYLSEILVRDPGLFDVFGARETLDATVAREDLEAQLALLRQAHDAEAAPYRLRDGETLRVGMHDLLRGASVTQVGQSLTQLAEVCLAYALERAQQSVGQRYGRVDGACAVLGLGKLGGREMGYGSDLDLVFVYDADATTESGMAPSEYFAALAATTFNRLKEPTRYGALYHIDARLRPDGKKGVLAVTQRRLEEYYGHEAQPWERLALMKARAVAGDPAFADAVENAARDLAFSLPLTRQTLAHIDDIRSRLAQAAPPLDLKKSEGGLAGLEFTIRLLQLRHVARFPELKRGDALGALQALAQRGLLPLRDADALEVAYLVLRRVENRIRMMHGRSDSSLPGDPEAQAQLAKRLGIEGDLAAIVASHKRAVHAIYKKVLEKPAREA